MNEEKALQALTALDRFFQERYRHDKRAQLEFHQTLWDLRKEIKPFDD